MLLEHRFTLIAWGLCALAAVGGCIGEIGSLDQEQSGAPAVSEENAALVGVSGLRRLTVDEYDNTLRDVLGDDTRPSVLLLPDDVRNPFDNDYTNQIASQALIEGAELLASDAAERLLADTARRDQIVGCTPSGPSDSACLRQFIQSFGRKVMRRSLSDEEVTAYMSVQQHAVAAGDFYVAVGTIVLAMLQDPKFLYRVEIGTPVAGRSDLFRLSGTELAARMSYFLWGSAPSDWLLDRAENGQLETPAEVRDAAVKMLADERARRRIQRFHALWLGYEKLPYDAALVQAMQTETNALLERVIFDEQRPWQDVFRSDETFVNDTLAQHYGLTPPGSTEPTWVSYGDSGRKGLLSHGTFLSNGAKFDDTSPTIRGLIIRTRLFCQVIPPPPPEVNTDDAIPVTSDAVCKKDRYYQLHAQGGCADCHKLMDPVGFGLENFDQQGRYRTTEADHPECAIDGVGELDGVGSFKGPAGLADLMLGTGLLSECVTTQLYRFAMGRYELDDYDTQLVRLLTEQLGGGDFRFDELVLGLVENEAFRYRRVEP